MIRALVLAVATAALAACNPAPPVDSFCEKYRAKDFADPGLRAQSKANKEADLVNERTRERDCLGDRAKPAARAGGPR